MPKAYVIAQVDVHDQETYDTYRAGTPDSIASFGGEFIVRGGAIEGLEGEPPRSRMVVIEFPSQAQAKAWYDSEEYTALREIRQRAASADVVLAEGV